MAKKYTIMTRDVSAALVTSLAQGFRNTFNAISCDLPDPISRADAVEVSFDYLYMYSFPLQRDRTAFRAKVDAAVATYGYDAVARLLANNVNL